MISYSTDYRGVANGAFDAPPAAGGSYRLGFQDFRDGSSSTFMYGEVDNSVQWVDSSGNASTNDWAYSWAQGYWFNSRGHVQGVFNLSGEHLGIRFSSTSYFPQRPCRRSQFLYGWWLSSLYRRHN